MPVKPRWRSRVEATPPRSCLQGGGGCLVVFLSLKKKYILKKKEGGGGNAGWRHHGLVDGVGAEPLLVRHRSVGTKKSRFCTKVSGFNPGFALLRLSRSAPNHAPHQDRPHRDPLGKPRHRGPAPRGAHGRCRHGKRENREDLAHRGCARQLPACFGRAAVSFRLKFRSGTRWELPSPLPPRVTDPMPPGRRDLPGGR